MKIPVGILGATGLIGQHYVQLLQNHPWFELAFLGASQEGSYEECVKGKWHLPSPIPKEYRVFKVEDIEKAKKNCSFVFSALPNELAKEIEIAYASEGLPVVSNASAHRFTPDVPILIPEVNPEHLGLIRCQQKQRGWKRGFIVAKPNCSVQSFIIPLTPLHRKFEIKSLFVTTLQAMSGAGQSGLPSHVIHDNVIPFIQGEEEKAEKEPLKIWGKLQEGSITLATSLSITAHCNRVPVLDGHLACISVSFVKKPSLEDILGIWNHFSPPLALPSSPKAPIVYKNEPDRPQVRLDRNAGERMSVTVGRLRPCSLLDYRFVGLSHNMVRGGAGGALLIAELLKSEGYLGQ